MDIQPETTTNNQTTPAWFASPTNSLPPTLEPAKTKKRRSLIIGAAIILAVAGGIVWYLFAVHAAKVEAFQQFRSSYETIETGFIDFDDITEPENLNSDVLTASWTAYLSAFNTLATTSIYKDNQPLIEDIKTSSLAYKTYTTWVIPAVTRYLTECNSAGDETMYGAVCRGYIQTAIDSNDTLTGDTLRELQALLTQMSQDNKPTQARYDTIQELQEKLFAVGRTIQTTVRPKIIEFGRKIGVDVPVAQID